MRARQRSGWAAGALLRTSHVILEAVSQHSRSGIILYLRATTLWLAPLGLPLAQECANSLFGVAFDHVANHDGCGIGVGLG